MPTATVAFASSSEVYGAAFNAGLATENTLPLPMSPYPCEEATETAVPRGTVPHFLPGTSPLPGLNKDLTDRFGTPYEPRLGGAATMYPEYIKKMQPFPRPNVKAEPAAERGQ